MNSTLLRYDARRLFPFWIVSVIAMACYFVVAKGPLVLSSHAAVLGSFPTVLSAVLFGVIVGGRLMADTGATHSFVLSRGLTRRQLALHRLALGLLVIFGTSVLLWLLLASSVRSVVHQRLHFEDAVFYPILSQFESPAAFVFFKVAVVVLLTVVFLQTARSLRDADVTTTAGGLVRFWIAELPVMLFCAFLFAAFVTTGSNFSPVRDVTWNWVTGVVSVLAAALAVYTTRYTEAGR